MRLVGVPTGPPVVVVAAVSSFLRRPVTLKLVGNSPGYPLARGSLILNPSTWTQIWIVPPPPPLACLLGQPEGTRANNWLLKERWSNVDDEHDDNEASGGATKPAVIYGKR